MSLLDPSLPEPDPLPGVDQTDDAFVRYDGEAKPSEQLLCHVSYCQGKSTGL